MPGWVKGLLITTIVIVVLVVGLIGAGFIWWVRNKDSLRAQAKETAAEGREFGQNSDNQGCVDETFLRYKKEPAGFFRATNYAQFMRTCLEVSRPTPAFCDNVPVGKMMPGKMMETMAWRESQCRHYGLPNDQKCGQLLFGEMMFCSARKRANETKSEGGLE